MKQYIDDESSDEDIWEAFARTLKDWSPEASDLPRDLAENHDKYIYGEQEEYAELKAALLSS